MHQYEIGNMYIYHFIIMVFDITKI